LRDFRYNDISCGLRRAATRLENEAKQHRILADKLDIVTSGKRPDALQIAPALKQQLDDAAAPLIHLPAAQMRKAASAAAHASGQPVLCVAIHARNMRADLKAEQRRQNTVDLLKALGRGLTRKDAAKLIGISVATADRLRDAWVKGGNA
jgi:hypothetical protein